MAGKKIGVVQYKIYPFSLRSCLKLKWIFEGDILISLAKLGFSCIAKAMEEKIAEVQWSEGFLWRIKKLAADFQFDFKQLLSITYKVFT